MSNNSTEDIIGTLYDMVQDARSMPLAADKCILERDRVLDLLDEIISQLPAEIKQSRTIVESRNELISQARREAEGILRQAQDRANELVAKEEIYKEAKKRMAKVQRLEGRLRAKGFYEKMGYTVCSAPFDEAGLPHVKMERHID